MKHLKSLILSLLTLITFSFAHAQEGTLRGSVIDDENGESLMSVSVFIDGTSVGTRTDLDGKFSLKLPAGLQTVTFTYMSYNKQVVTDINIKPNEVTELNVRLVSAKKEIKTVVIKAERTKNNEVAMLTIQRKSANVMDGVSAETFKKTGDNDAATAISRVTGVSVEGGKYVYVRGLGDRYTKSQLNGVDIPGLDPDRNTVQMDIFPTNLLDNLIVYKTFTPNLPGDFTGGMINVETKSFVSDKTLGFSASLGYTPGMNFNSQSLTYKGSPTDFLGFGNSTRKLPISNINNIPARSDKDPSLTNITKSFNNQLAPTYFTSLPNASFAFSSGNQYKKEKYTIGYNTAVNYRSQFRHYQDYKYGRSIKDADNTENELTQLTNTLGERSEQEVQWSALVGGAVKTKKSKYILNLLHSQNAVSRSAQYDIKFPNGLNTALPLKQMVLDYSQRSVTNALLAGKHSLKNDAWVIDWKLSPTLSKIIEPDIRSTTYIIEEGKYIIDNGDGAVPERFFRDLTEVNAAGKFDITYKFKSWNGLESKLSFGGSSTFKNRDYQVLRFIFNNTLNTEWTGNGNELLANENIWTTENNQGTYITAEESLTNNPNIYQATQTVHSAYVMNELPVTNKLKAIYGVRYERTDNWISGYGRFPGEGIDENKLNEKVLEANDFLPALNLIYNLKDNMNLRASYSRTLARPSFKEKSFVSILDPLSNIRFIGNIDLERTSINNVDVRWENFFGQGEMFSISGFYKHFTNPIEIAGFLLEPNDITPRNAGTAQVMGVELEARKDFGFISEGLKNFSIGTNITLVRSLIDMKKIVVAAGNDGTFGTEDDMTEYDSRLTNLRQGETLSQHRPMFGQSPYIVNVNLSYNNDSLGLETRLSYNVQGKRLSVVGVGIRPDVYDQPFHSLNFKASKKLTTRWKASFTVQNIMNDRRDSFFESYQATSQIFESYNPGRQFSMGISYLID
jgi:TonB-dependent receptor